MHDSRRDEASRREFLRKILKAGAYAAPVVAILSMRTVAAAQGQASSPHPPPMGIHCGGLPGW